MNVTRATRDERDGGDRVGVSDHGDERVAVGLTNYTITPTPPDADGDAGGADGDGEQQQQGLRDDAPTLTGITSGYLTTATRRRTTPASAGTNVGGERVGAYPITASGRG